VGLLVDLLDSLDQEVLALTDLVDHHQRALEVFIPTD
jgi:hypothetical protein